MKKCVIIDVKEMAEDKKFIKHFLTMFELFFAFFLQLIQILCIIKLW